MRVNTLYSIWEMASNLPHGFLKSLRVSQNFLATKSTYRKYLHLRHRNWTSEATFRDHCDFFFLLCCCWLFVFSYILFFFFFMRCLSEEPTCLFLPMGSLHSPSSHSACNILMSKPSGSPTMLPCSCHCWWQNRSLCISFSIHEGQTQTLWLVCWYQMLCISRQPLLESCTVIPVLTY